MSNENFTLFKNKTRPIGNRLNKRLTVFLICLLSTTMFTFAQQELFNFGVDDPDVDIWSWNSNEFIIVDNPAGDVPSPTVRSWEKQGNWTGFGATLQKPVLLDGIEELAIHIYNDSVPINKVNFTLKGAAGDLIDSVIILDLAAKTWGVISVPVDISEGSFNEILIMPDGDVAENIATNYLLSSVMITGEIVLETPVIELFNFGVDNPDFDIWSWNSNEFIIVDNPAGDVPSPTVRSWEKQGDNTGFGATLENAVLLDGIQELTFYIYNDSVPINKVIFQLKDAEGTVLIDSTIALDLAAETWGVFTVPVEINEGSFNEILIMPDNDVTENIGTNYLLSSVMVTGEIVYDNPVAFDFDISFSEGITIDGDVSDWDDVDAIDINVPTDDAVIDDEVDFSANFKAVWDDNNLYLNVNVTDSEVDNDPTAWPWRRDGMELAFNMIDFDIFDVTNMLDDEDEGKIVVVYGDNTDSTKTASDRRLDMLTSLDDGYELATSLTDDGYTIELVLPFANIAPEFTAANGVKFQMAMVLADRDNGDREAKLTYGGKNSINQDNSDFPTVTLKGKEAMADDIDISYAENITIDGDLSDWDTVTAVAINIPTDDAIIDDEVDFSANFKAVWDDNNLYLNVNVTDSEVDNDPTAWPWRRDGMELAFNMIDFDIFDVTNMLDDEDEGKIVVVYGDNTDSTKTASDRRLDMLTSLDDGYELVTTKTDDGYSIELVMPFANIAPEFTAANGVEFQMAMVLADRDNGDREAKLTWGGKKSINQDNSDFPTITLTGKDVVGISEKHQFSMLVYPNPVAGNRLHVSFNNVEGETGYVTLTSLHGQVVVTQTIEANEQLLVLPSGITPGMYLINLKVGENTTTQRIIIK